MVYIYIIKGCIQDESIMLKLIKNTGKFFSTTRTQTNKINYYAEKINNYLVTNPEKALKYADKLIVYVQKIETEKKICRSVQQWLEDNSPHEIKKRVEKINKHKNLQNTVHQLSSSAKLPSIYKKYQGKDSFSLLIDQKLNQIDKGFQVESLHGGNNPIVKIHHHDKIFIVRLLRMNKEEEESGASSRFIRETYCQDISQIPQPYLIEWVADDGHELSYIEYSQYYAEGSLQGHFETLREQRKQKTLGPDEFDKELLLYTKKLIEFFVSINDRKIWYTDLKPSNVLLDNGQIVISDIKGLVVSNKNYIESYKTNTSKSYYKSSVFNQNQVDLELLQCQTLATTLYQLACGELPQQVQEGISSWNNVYNFKHPVFTGEEGKFLKHLIKKLSLNVPVSMSKVLDEINERLSQMEVSSQEAKSDVFIEPQSYEKINYSSSYQKI